MNTSLRRLACALTTVALAVPAALTAQSGPELSVVGTPSGLTSAIRGQEDSVSVTIGNTGDTATSTTFDVSVYLSADETPQTVEKVGDLAVSTALGAGENRTLTIPVRVPSLQSLGDYVWLVQVDAANVVAESDETNNVGVGNAIAVVPTPPDLIVSSLPSGPVEVALGASVSVVTAIQNVGEGATNAPFDVSVYLSVDDTFDETDTRVGRITLPDVVLPDETRSISILASIPEDLAEGAYRWVAVVNADGGQVESDDGNNASTGTPTTAVLRRPDLAPTAPPSGPSAVYRGVTTDVTVTLTNDGDGATTQPFDVVVYASQDPFAGNEDDVKVGDVAVTMEIAVGETHTVTVPSRLSAVQPTGVYHWIAVVDDGGFVTESDESNNTAVGTPFSVLLQPSDLVVADAPEGPALVIRNSFHDVTLAIENRGAGTTTGAFQVSVYLSGNDVAGDGDDIRIGNLTVADAMIESERRELTVPVTIPSDQAVGTYRFLAIVDATGVEVEFDEANNDAFAAAPVVVSLNSPDLAVITDPFGPAKILRDGSYTVVGEIQNQSGGVLASDFVVSAVLSVDDEIGNGDDVSVGEALISGGMLSGEIITMDIPVSIPVGVALGDFRWGVVVDPADEVNEVNEVNNARAGSAVTVVPFPPDLVVGAPLTGPDEVSRGRLYTVPVTVENAGQGVTIAGFDVSVYLSTNDSVGDGDDLLVGTALVEQEIGPSETRVVEVSVIIPGDQPPAQFTWAAIINPDGRVVEGDRTNNAALGNAVAFPVLDLPTSLSFGSMALGQSKTRVLEITNTGTAALSFDVESLSPLVTTNPPTVSGLAPGETQVIAITVTPTEAGTFDGDVRITSELRGTQIISLGGQTVIPNRDRVRVDLDTAVGLQDALERRLGVNQTVSLELHVEALPEVSTVAIEVAYDPAAVALTTNGLTAGSFVSADALLQTRIVTPGLMEVALVSQSGNLGDGSGHLGTLAFRTIGGFYDPSGTGTSSIEAVSIRYVASADGVETTIDVSAAVNLRLDLACWSDFDASGEVGFADFLQIVNAFNASPSSPGWAQPIGDGVALRRLDANGDDVVDFGDFVIFQTTFGSVCE